MKFVPSKITSADASRSRLRIQRNFSAAAVLLVAAVSGCGTTPGAAETTFDPGEKAPGETGEVSFNLQVGDATVQTVTYELKRSGFQKTGTIDVSHAPRVSAVVAGVPLGTGYTATLRANGTSAESFLQCSGSASFDVNTPGATPVDVHMACQESANTVPVPKGANGALCALLVGAGFALSSRRRRTRTG
jgi:hypothetical protein